MRESFSRIREKHTEDSAYLRARALAEQAVKFAKVEFTYVGAAIDYLTGAGDFESWLKRLHRGDKVSIHLHYYERLVAIVEAQADMVRERAAHVEFTVQHVRRSSIELRGPAAVSTAGGLHS